MDSTPQSRPGNYSGNPAEGTARAGQDIPNLNRELRQQNAQTFEQAQQQIEQQKKDELGKSYIERYEEIRRLGFMSAQDVQERLDAHTKTNTELVGQLNAALEEVKMIKALLNMPRNSGLLDGMKKEAPKNPLLPDKYRVIVPMPALQP